MRETCCGRRGLPPALHRACGMGMVYDCEQAGVLRETGTANGGTAAGVRGWDCVRLRACRRAEKAAKAGDLGTATGIAGLGLCKIASMPAC